MQIKSQPLADKILRLANKTSFAGADMRGADFYGANLDVTILTKASILQADLGSVNFAQAFGDTVTFDKSDLTNWIFADSLLTGSTFYAANIEGADFSGALVNAYQAILMSKRASSKNTLAGIDTMVSLGCHENT